MSRTNMRNVWGAIEALKKEVRGLRNIIESNKLNRMHKIYLKDYRITVPCKRCLENGEILEICNQCGGKGTHRKTKQKWEVNKRPITIDSVTCYGSGDIKYWTSSCEFYRGKDKLVYFNIEDAQRECDKRNKDL